MRLTQGPTRFFLAISLIVSGSAKANVLYSNLGLDDSYRPFDGYFVDGANFANQTVAMPFTLENAAIVANAQLALAQFQGSNHSMSVFVGSDQSGLPGEILTSFSQSGTIRTFASGGGLTTFTCNTNCWLGAGTYWLIAQQTDPNTGQIWLHTSGQPSGSVAFNMLGDTSGPWFHLQDMQGAFKIEDAATATEVPEPGGATLITSGLVGLIAIRLRFRPA
jgi:hypothetical protein